MNNKAPTADTRVPRPWYRHAWPWLFAAVFLAAVVGSIYTVRLALRNAPTSTPGGERTGLLVSSRPPTQARIVLGANAVTASFTGPAPRSDTVHLVVVRDAALERFVLVRGTDGKFRGEFGDDWRGAPTGVTDYVLEAPDASWSLRARDLSTGRTLILSADEPADP